MFDFALQKLLRSKANFGILEGFLSELLFTDIEIVEILEAESNREVADDRSNQVDIKVKDGGALDKVGGWGINETEVKPSLKEIER